MQKVFLIHGFQGSPNGGWRPWLMAELDKKDIYACALPMPSPENPDVEEWNKEIARYVENNDDEIFLIGHSLGSPSILHYLETPNAKNISGAILVSGPIEPVDNKKIEGFLDKEFNFKKIMSKCKNFCVIHGKNDPNVPLDHAKKLSKNLNCELIVIEKGGHLNGSSGWTALPQVMLVLNEMLIK